MKLLSALALALLSGCSWISPECKAAREQLAQARVSLDLGPAVYRDSRVSDAERFVERWCKGPG